MKQPVVLALDIGSSSIRCSAYLLNPQSTPDTSDGVTVKALPGCSSSRPIQCIQTTTGKILLDQCSDGVSTHLKLLDEIDYCVDATLEKLRSFTGNTVDEEISGVLEPLISQVVAVGISTFVMNLVGVDIEGNFVKGATLSYACNTKRVSTECRMIRESTEAEKLRRIYQRTGCPLHSAYALPQLRVFYEQHEKNEDATTVFRWQTIASLVLSRWTGRKELPISFSEASWTGLLNIHTCEWDTEILQYLPKSCQDALPNLKDSIDSSAVLGGIREYNVTSDKKGVKHKNPYWERWPELRGLSGVEVDGGFGCCRLFLGLGDGASANLGSKCTSTSRIAVTIGTSAAARVCLQLPATSSSPISPRSDRHDGQIAIPSGLWCYRITKDLALLGGALTDGGSVIDWSRNLLNLKGEEEFASCMEEVRKLVQEEEAQHQGQLRDVDDNSVDGNTDMCAVETFVPFLSGERSTGFRFEATAVMSGLTRNTTPARFIKSCMEGVTLRLNAIVKMINSTLSLDPRLTSTSRGKNKPILVASGTALEKNPVWRRMIANCSEMEVVTDSNVNESTSRGVARLVAATVCMEYSPGVDGDKGVGFLLSEEKLFPIDVCKPSPTTKQHWAAEAHAQNELIDAVCTTWLSRGEAY